MIKVWDYIREYQAERDDILEGIEKVLTSGRLILGDSVANFEKDFASYCGMRFGIGVDNATNATFLALLAIGVKDGDEVITVSNTAVPTVSAIVSAGAIPKFVDIDPNNYLMRVDQVEQAITPKTRAIIPVHLYGQCVDMDPLLAISEKYGLHILEDCAQAHGSSYKGRKAGSMSTYSTFSFYPTKPLGTFGDGGIVLTDDESYDKRMRRLRFYGMEKTYYAEEHGFNSRLDELHAEILIRRLKHLDLKNDKRREIAFRYNKVLAKTSLKLPTEAAGNHHIYYIYVVAHPERDLIIRELANRNIHVNISYPWPIHTMRGYKHLGYENGDLPATESVAKSIFSLPMYPTLTDGEQDSVCEALASILGENLS